MYYEKKAKIPDPPGIAVAVINGNVEEALVRLKRKTKDENLFIELRRRERYQKPSDVRREKRAKARLRGRYRDKMPEFM